ncbi:SDR family NAD(P)-dependent oxidoreductase [Nocardia carnea]|uniref:SDR family NAD(P)-dependent oxidoreductase n=1 Tax=Nocardia carnea TaxID=37328 RepID=UPI0024539388|nr:SDR family oxidoreductase [Nocardia carnea]
MSTNLLLENKNAVIYGAGGAVGHAVARTFAREGARVFLAGRTASRVETVAEEIAAGGGAAEATQVDALDETAVAEHLDAVIEKAGGVDISFNAVGLRNTTLQGVPLADLAVEDFMRPITEHVRANFLTARLAGRHMTAKGSGVIMTVTSIPSRIANPLMGGVAVAMAAEEALIRDLSVEFAPHGVRVAGVRTQGMPDSGTIEEVFGIHAEAHGITREQFQHMVAERTHRKRLPTLQEMAEVVAFIASDRASGIAGTIANMSLGAIPD